MRRANVWKKAACVAVSLLYFLQIKPQVVQAADYWPEGPEVQSPSVILMEMSTGTVLYEKNSDERNYPASITKILTALIALENGMRSSHFLMMRSTILRGPESTAITGSR